MSHRIRRTLAVASLLAALVLMVPSTSHAAGLWNPAAPDVVASRIWSWLESLVGLSPRKPAPARLEKAGPGIDPNGTATPPATSSDQGSGIDPNGLK
jgi:hypothetical protein